MSRLASKDGTFTNFLLVAGCARMCVYFSGPDRSVRLKLVKAARISCMSFGGRA